MVDRQFVGDVGLAVLLAIPLVALTRPDPVSPVQQSAAATAQVQHIGNVTDQDRPVSLLR